MKIMLTYLQSFIDSSGGAEKVCCDMANAMTQRGHSVSIVYCYGRSGRPFFPLNQDVRLYNLMALHPEKWNGKINIQLPLFWKIGRELLRVISPGKAHGLQEYYIGNQIKNEIQSLVNKEHPDIVVAYWPRESNYLMNYAKVHVPVFTMFHFDPEILARDASRGSRYACEQGAGVSVLLPHAVERLHQYMPRANAIWMPNVVPQYPIPADLTGDKKKYTIIHVARFDKHQKRQHILVEAFGRIAERFPEWQVEIWGQAFQSKYKNELEQLIQKYHVEKQVFLKGTTDQVKEKYLAADIFAFPSAYEGFGMAMTEAMSAGLPVVAYKSCTAAAELITPECGVLVDDGVDAFVRGLADLMEHQKKRILMGKNARMAMREYASEKIWDRWEKLFKNIITS